MKRGFKSRCERISRDFRKKLGLTIFDAMPGRDLAKHLGVCALGVEDIPGFDSSHIDHLLGIDPDSWSGFTMSADSRLFIVHNTSSSEARQESNLMHELAHIICKHSPGDVLWIGPLCLRHYNPEQEEEAEWLGGALQAPREGLLKLLRQDLSIHDLCNIYQASKEMVNFRLHKGGIMKEFRRGRAKWRR